MTNEAVDEFIKLVESCNRFGTSGNWSISLNELRDRLEALKQ